MAKILPEPNKDQSGEQLPVSEINERTQQLGELLENLKKTRGEAKRAALKALEEEEAKKKDVIVNTLEQSGRSWNFFGE